MIETLREQYPQAELLAVFDVPRSSHSYRRKRQGKKDPAREALQEEIVAIHRASRGAAGSRTICGTLKQRGYAIGRHRTRSLMREIGIESKQPRGHRYRPATKPSAVADNLLNREFKVSRPNEVWCGDVTYVWTARQWLYLALVIDLYARRIIGWACSTSPDSELTMQALTVAWEARGQPTGVMFHSDQGCHYTSKAYRQKLQSYQIEQSMSRRGNCWDNAPMERCFRSYKSEWMPKTFYRSYSEAEKDIMAYIKYYNLERSHSYNGYLPPAMAENNAPA